MRRFRASAAVNVIYWLFVVMCFAVSIAVLRQHLPRFLPLDWPNAHEGDALSDWRAARLYPLDISPYTPMGLSMLVATMGHPPTTVFWYLPMVDFPKALAAELTSLALWFLIIPHVYMCAKALKWPAPMAWTGLFVSLAFSTSWFCYHFRIIQFSELIAFFYVLGWLFLRRGFDTRAGICIGLAATIKLFPGVMIVMLLLGRRWRAFFAASATFMIIACIMTHAFGVESWRLYSELQKPIAEIWYGAMQNSSLSGLLNQIRSPFCGSYVVPAHSSTPMIATVGACVLLGLTAWASRIHLKFARASNGDRIDLPFALFALMSVFLNPWVWEHYYVLAIQPLFVVTTEFARLIRLGYRRWSDSESSTLGLLGIASLSAFAFAGLFIVALALSRDLSTPWWYIDAWRLSKEPFYHFVAHVELALKLAPWIVPIVLCFIALRVSKLGWLEG